MQVYQEKSLPNAASLNIFLCWRWFKLNQFVAWFSNYIFFNAISFYILSIVLVLFSSLVFYSFIDISIGQEFFFLQSVLDILYKNMVTQEGLWEALQHWNKLKVNN